MNFVKEAIEDLRNYEPRKVAMLNLQDKIKTAEAKIYGLRSGAGGSGVKGGGEHDEALINQIAAKEKYQTNLKIISAFVDQVDRALAVLTEEERVVLDGFYINRPTDYRNRLCDKLHIEESTLYRIKDNAIKRFTIALYGIKDF